MVHILVGPTDYKKMLYRDLGYEIKEKFMWHNHWVYRMQLLFKFCMFAVPSQNTTYGPYLELMGYEWFRLWTFLLTRYFLCSYFLKC